MSRQYDVTREEVEAAWKAVRRAGGRAGHDGQTIEDIEKDLDNQLYKIWNRMSSGSLQAQPVLRKKIPKAKGGCRELGIPTVTDRIAQMVIKNRLEPIVEEFFHEDSYAYRPNKSAIDAVTVCRERCFKHEWLLEIDIKGFFDAIDHDLMMQMLEKHTSNKMVLLYAKRFLKASGRTKEGEEILREKGTPQGGVVSPIFANLYLHMAFDQWMRETHPSTKFERYADDCVVHCVSEEQALFIKGEIEERLFQYRLELHPEKTRVIYTGMSNDYDNRGHKFPRKFTFLGYDFKPRMNRRQITYSPGIGKGALKAILHKIKEGWKLQQRYGEDIAQIAQSVNPVIRGWINYYGYHRRSDLYQMAVLIDTRLVKFLKRKHKDIKTVNQGWIYLRKIKRANKELFCHWHMISLKR